MSEPFIGQILMFGFNFPPRGWALCDGQVLPISSNTALFSLLGTTYGGNGTSTFGLPDLRGRSPRHFGNGPGLAATSIGQVGGIENSNLTLGNLPPHSHTLRPKVSSEIGNVTSPVGNIPAIPNDGESNFVDPAAVPAPAMELNDDGGATGNAGEGSSFSNLPPYLTINFSIALVGIFPPRN